MTGALDSSLWEMAALQKHYLSSVSSLAKVFTEVMNKQSYSMEDFLDHSYATVRLLSLRLPVAPIAWSMLCLYSNSRSLVGSSLKAHRHRTGTQDHEPSACSRSGPEAAADRRLLLPQTSVGEAAARGPRG